MAAIRAKKLKEQQEKAGFIAYRRAVNAWYEQEPPLWKIVSRIRWLRRRPEPKTVNT